MKKVGIALIISMLIFGIFIFGENIKYGGTLVVGGNAPTFIVQNFNPFFLASGVSDLEVGLVYEPLMYVNSLTGVETPMLATSYKWEENNLKMIVTIRKDVKWNDGIPFTPNDVVFTFNLMKRYPALDLNGIWTPAANLQSVQASGDNVIFTFSKPNVPFSYYILRTLIVPEHIWSKISDPTTFVNANNPVGTGPFLRTDFSVANNTEYFTKNPNYWWKGRPYVNAVRVIGNTSNQAAFLQLLDGEVAWNDIGIENAKTMWIDKDPQNNLIYMPVHDIYMLIPNDAKPPFNNATFRRAISLALNRRLLEDRVFAGIGGYDVSQTMIAPAQREEWYDTKLSTIDAYITSYNPDEAQKLLESIGYRKNANGDLVGPDGKILPTFTLLDQAGNTDLLAMGQIISQELKAIGINVSIVQYTYSNYLSNFMTGNFDLGLAWSPVQGPTPFYEYYANFFPTFSAPIGQTAISDFSRYTNPVITEALTEYMSSSDLNTMKESMYKVENILVNEVPVIVFMNRTGHDLYSQKEFVGWPSESNPYSMGWNGAGLGNELVILNVHLK